MRFFNEFGLGISTYSRAWNFIKVNKLWGYMLIPGLINLAIFLLLGWGAWSYGSYVTNWFTELFKIETQWIQDTIFWMTFFVVRLSTALLFYYTYRYIILILLSPALAVLAEKIYEIQTGIKRPFILKQFLKDVLRGIALAGRNLALEIMLLLVITLIGFIPVIGFISPFLSFFVSAYYYGFSMVDYRNEIKQMTIRESIFMIKRHKGLVLGNGSVFSLMMMIPFFGALFAPILALVASHLAVSDLERKEKEDLDASKRDQPIPIG